MNTRGTIVLTILLVAITAVVYSPIVGLFYQQDEWQTIGNAIILNNFFDLFKSINPIQAFSVQERFGSNLLSYFLMGKFAFNTQIMGIYSLFFHILNTILVYVIIRKWIIRDTAVSFLAALFFAFSDVSISAVSWFGTSLGTLPAVTFILLAMISYFEYIQTNRVKWIFLTLVLLYVSLFFKEIGIFLFILLPFSALFLKTNSKFSLMHFLPFFGIFIFAVTLRIINLVFLSDRSGELFVTSSENDFIPTVVSRIIMYPFTSFSLTFIPSQPLLLFAKYITHIYYPFVPSEQFNLIAQTTVIDTFAVLTTCAILAAVYFSVRKADRDVKMAAVFWIIFFVMSFFPYVLLGKSYAYLESRYYYLANLPAGILLGICTIALRGFLEKWKIGFLALVFVTVFLLFHIVFLVKDLKQLSLISEERISFLSQLSNIKPQLSDKKNIFYVTGNHDFYIPGNNVPFQQGMGYTLMAWYYSKGNVPGKLIQERFLWNLNTQGYKEFDGSGFGFFYDKEALEKSMREYHLAESQVVALYYDASLKILRRVDNQK